MTATNTTQNFNDMLKKYLPYDLLTREFIKRDYFMSKVNIKDGWMGGQMDVPFKSAKATDYQFGGLIDAAKLGKARYGIGHVDAYKELWGAMVFEDHDLMRHGNLEQSFIKIIPDQIEDFIFGMKEVVSRSLLNGGHIAKLTAGNPTPVGGENAEELAKIAATVIVTRPEFFDLDQYVELRDSANALIAGGAGYITEIDMDKMSITLCAVRLDSFVTYVANGLDLTAAVAGDKFGIVGDSTDLGFTSLDSQILPLAHGGSANIFGVDKLSSPYTQSYALDGAGGLGGVANAQALLDAIFRTQNRVRAIANGSNPTDAVMGYTNLGNLMTALENGGVGAGAGRQYFAKDTKASIYGWTEIEVVGVGGSLKLVGVNEMADDSIKILDWRGIDLHTNGLFERHKDINGNEYTVERVANSASPADNGFKYITDTRMFGELVVSKPAYQAVIHNL